MKHPWEHIIIAFAQDTSVEIEARYTDGLGEKWHTARIEDVLKPSLLHIYEFRLKPAMRSITLQDGTIVEWPEPMRVAPVGGTRVWGLNIFCEDNTMEFKWCGSMADTGAFKAGFCHLTEEAARQHRRAIVLANGGEL